MDLVMFCAILDYGCLDWFLLKYDFIGCMDWSILLRCKFFIFNDVRAFVGRPARPRMPSLAHQTPVLFLGMGHPLNKITQLNTHSQTPMIELSYRY